MKTVVPKGTVGSNPTPSARKCDFVKFHEWLVARESLGGIYRMVRKNEYTEIM